MASFFKSLYFYMANPLLLWVALLFRYPVFIWLILAEYQEQVLMFSLINRFRTLNKLSSLVYLDLHGGFLDPEELKVIQNALGGKVQLNKFKFSSVARPTVGPRRSSIWGLRVRDWRNRSMDFWLSCQIDLIWLCFCDYRV